MYRCVSAHTHFCVCFGGMHIGKRTALRSWFSPSTFMWFQDGSQVAEFVWYTCYQLRHLTGPFKIKTVFLEMKIYKSSINIAFFLNDHKISNVAT